MDLCYNYIMFSFSVRIRLSPITFLFRYSRSNTVSGAETNLKVGGGRRHRSAGKKNLVVPVHFLALKVQ